MQTDIKLTYTPFANQLKAHQATYKHILFGGAVGGGKSCWLVNDALYYCLGWNGVRVGLFRWQYSEFRATTYKTMEEWLFSHIGLIKKHDKNNKEVTLFNGSQIVYGGLKPSESASGDLLSKIRSLELAAGYIDEVTDVPEDVYDFWSTRMRRSKGINVFTGKIETPPPRCANSCNPRLCWVKTRWVDGRRPGYLFIRSRVGDNIYQPPEYEQDLRDEWCDNPTWVDQYLNGDWNAVTDFEAIYPADVLAAAVRRSIKVTDDDTVYFGVDVGEYGNDPTVVMMRKGMKATMLLVQNKQSTMQTVRQVAMLADKHCPENINIDAIGVGSGPADRLTEMGYPIVRMLAGGKANVKGFRNKRAQWYWGLRRLLMDGRADLPNESKLISELGTVRYLRDTSDRTIQVESKKLLRKRLGRSPDYADATVLCYADDGWDLCVTA